MGIGGSFGASMLGGHCPFDWRVSLGKALTVILEEIQLQNREFFTEAGGEVFSYIPALNDQSMHINALCELIKLNCQGWPEFSEQKDRGSEEQEKQLRYERAQKMGAHNQTNTSSG